MLYWRYLKSYIKLYPAYFWSGVGALFFTDILDVIPPLIMMRGVDQITQNAGLKALLQTALLFAGLTLALAVVRYHWRMQFGKFHQNLARDFREKIFNRLTELGPGFYLENPIGELMSFMSNDVEAIRMGMGPGLLVIIDGIFYLMIIPPIMLKLSVPLTIKCLALLPVLPFFINWLGNVVQKRFLAVQESFTEMSGITQENITGIRVIKSYVQEKNQINIFNQSSNRWKETSLKVAWAETFMHPVMEFCVTVGVVMLLLVGSKEVLAGTLSIGTFVAFRRYISQMVWPMTAFGWGYSLISTGRASLERVHKLLETRPEVLPIENKTSVNLFGPIEIKNLTFTYPKSTRPALKDISLTIEPGSTLGIVGPVGSGKTTLAQLICHLYEIDRGQIFVNHIDVRDIPLRQLRHHISFVPQDTFLFSASVSDNMAFGLETPPTLEALLRVAEVAKLDEEINSLPQQYATYLGERGVNLSGGQKQRMTITRALLRRSPVIIFDDSLSAVDAETESLILKRLKEETKEHTTIIISHRLSSLSLCDRIVVLKEGVVEALGSASQLRTSSSTYRELLELQGYL